MKTTLPLRHLLLSLSLGASPLLAQVDRPESSVYAPTLTENWEDIQWLDDQGKPATYGEEDTLTLGKDSTATGDDMPTYKIRLNKTIYTQELYFAERADWYLMGEGVTLGTGEGPISPLGNLNIELNHVSRYYNVTKGNALLVNQGGSLSGQTLTCIGGFVYFEDSSAEIYHIVLQEGAHLKAVGNSQIKFYNIDMTANSQLEIAGMSISPRLEEGDKSGIVLDNDESEQFSSIKGKTLSATTLQSAELVVDERGGHIASTEVIDSHIKVEGSGALLQLTFVDLTNSTLSVAEDAIVEINGIILRPSLSSSSKVTPKKYGKPLTALTIDSFDINGVKSTFKSILEIYPTLTAEAKSSYAKASKDKERLAVVFKDLPAALLALDKIEAALSVEDDPHSSETNSWQPESIDSTPDGDAIIIFKKG